MTRSASPPGSPRVIRSDVQRFPIVSFLVRFRSEHPSEIDLRGRAAPGQEFWKRAGRATSLYEGNSAGKPDMPSIREKDQRICDEMRVLMYVPL
jgi:hypothetical protein